MTGDGFLDCTKTVGCGQAKASGGMTDFMQTGSGRLEGLQCISFHAGPGRHAVLVDVLPFLVREHRIIEKERPTWLGSGDVAGINSELDRREEAVFRDLERDIHSSMGANTLIFFIVDGALRPEAKLDKMNDRERARREKAKRQKPLPCGQKPADVLDVQTTPKRWMQSYGNTLWIEAHDEADLLIAHIVSFAHPAGTPLSTPTPDHSHFDTPAIRHAIALLTAIPVSHRTIATRDSDLAACNVGKDVGWFIHLEWHGKLEKLTLKRNGVVAPRVAQGNTPAGQPAGQGGAPAAQVPAHRPRGPDVAAQYRGTRGGKVAELPSRHGNYIVFSAAGLDALPALGADRPRRIRIWSLCGNDYVRHGVKGISYKIVASGILDELLSRPFAAATLVSDLTYWLGRLASDSKSDVDWRGGGRSGRVRKLDKVVLPEHLIPALIESDRLGNGLGARLYIPSTSRSGAKSLLDFGGRPPHIVRKEVTDDGNCVPSDPSASPEPEDHPRGRAILKNPAPLASHPYAGRPSNPGEPPRPTEKDERRLSTIQPRRPNEARPGTEAARKASTAKFRPRGQGESVVDACADYQPEPIEIDAETLARHREWKAKKEAAEAKREQDRAEWAKQREDELKELEENGDDEFELRDDDKSSSRLKGLESIYDAKMSHAEPITAAFRDFTATALPPPPPPPVPPAPSPTKRRSRHRSGRKCRRARHRRMTTPPKKGAPASAVAGGAAATGTGATAPATAGGASSPKGDTSTGQPVQVPPDDVASIAPLVTMLWLAVQVSLGVASGGYQALTVGRLDKGEAGVKLVSKAAQERNGIARELSRLARYGDPDWGGKGLKIDPLTKADLGDAGELARDAGHPSPPAMPVSTYTQAFLPLQTAIKAIAENWILDDLFGLGAFVMTAPEANANHVLSFVFARSHKNITFSDSTRASLDILSRAPDSNSRFRSAMGHAIGSLVRDHPYDPRCAKAGEEDPADRDIPGGSRQSQRKGVSDQTQASKAKAYGIAEKPTKQQKDAPAVVAATVEDTFVKDDKTDELKEFRQVIKAMLKNAAKERPEEPMPPDAAQSLEDDFLRFVYCIICFVARNIEMSLTLSGCQKKDACAKKTIGALIAGHARLSRDKFSKSLLYLALTLRRMQDMDESRLLPFFDPEWINASIIDILRLSQADQLTDFLTSLERQMTEAVRQLLPLVQHVDDKGAEILAVIRQLFELRRKDGSLWEWADAEKAGASCAAQPTVLADILAATVQIRPHLRSRTEAVSPTLSKIFGTDEPISAYVERHHAKVETLNIVGRREVQAQRFVATGMIQFTAHHVRFFGVKVDVVKADQVKAAEGLDAGLFFSRSAQQAWSQLNLSDYFSDMSTAYNVSRTNGAWTTSPITPLAQPGMDKMNASRAQPQPLLMLDSAIPRHAKYRLDLRLRRAAERAAGRMVSPSQLRTAIRRVLPPDRTRDGLPNSWGSVKTEHTRDRLDRFTSASEPDEIGYGGFDLGVKNPVAAYLSSPSSPAPGSGASRSRSEGSVVYSRNRLLALERRNSEEMAHINSNLAHQLDKDRFATSPPGQLRPPSKEVLRDTWIRILTKAHPVRDRIQLRYGIERDAEIATFVSELGRAIAGKIKRQDGDRAKIKWIFFVGDGMSISSPSGASSQNTIMRALPAELRRRGIPCMFVRTPEDYTSQRCPNPRCRRADDEERRSCAETMTREDGSPEYRLLRCLECGCVFNRDGAGACNILAMGLSWWWYGRPLWGAWIEEG